MEGRVIALAKLYKGMKLLLLTTTKTTPLLQ